MGQHQYSSTAFALQMARPSHGSDDHVKWQSCLQQENSVPDQYFRAKYIDTQRNCIFFKISYWDFQEKFQTEEKSFKNERRAMDVLQKKNNFYDNPNATLYTEWLDKGGGMSKGN